jgi:DNA-directed RNA polymerase specialized sigma24 family protein
MVAIEKGMPLPELPLDPALGQFVPEAEDARQETFLRARHATESFRGESEFSSWIERF